MIDDRRMHREALFVHTVRSVSHKVLGSHDLQSSALLYLWYSDLPDVSGWVHKHGAVFVHTEHEYVDPCRVRVRPGSGAVPGRHRERVGSVASDGFRWVDYAV